MRFIAVVNILPKGLCVQNAVKVKGREGKGKRRGKRVGERFDDRTCLIIGSNILLKGLLVQDAVKARGRRRGGVRGEGEDAAALLSGQGSVRTRCVEGDGKQGAGRGARGASGLTLLTTWCAW